MAFWYLASPYSKYPLGITAAHFHVCQQAALLIRSGVPVYSPIAHMHPIAQFGDIDPFDHDIWLPVDRHMMDAAGGLIVLKMEGWSRSYGMAEEMKHFAAGGYKPIVFMDPGVVPDVLLREGR